MTHVSQHIHISPHHAAPCSEPAGAHPAGGHPAGAYPLVELREDREGPSRLQSDMGQSSASTSEGIAAERG